MRTKGAKNKVVHHVEKVETPPVIEKKGITEIGGFGNQEMIQLVAKVNEIIRFINK